MKLIEADKSGPETSLLDLFASSKSIDQWGIDGIRTLSPEGRVLFAQPQSKFELAVARSTPSVHLQFGIVATATSAIPPTQGVVFRVLVQDRSGRATNIWSRTLNPTAEPQDRGLQDAVVSLHLVQGDKLVLETVAVANPESCWAYWKQVAVPLQERWLSRMLRQGGYQNAALLCTAAAWHFMLLVIPCLAVAAWLVRVGMVNRIVLALAMLTSTGLFGYICFFSSFLNSSFGRVVAVSVPLVGVIWLIFTFKRLDLAGRRAVGAVLLPFCLILAVTLLVLAVGFLRGGFDRPLVAATVRFTHELPADNILPLLFAEDIYSGVMPRPMFGDWLSSDRPPLQAGLVLSQLPLMWVNRELGYEIVSAIAQSFWVFALWIFLSACQVDRRAVGLALSTCLLSGFVFINSFYVWPKLLSASYLIGALVIFFVPRTATGRLQANFLQSLAATLIALAALSHGGAMFAIVALALVVPFTVRLSFRPLAIMGLTFAFFYSPWILYQRLYDPPGDRLLKWHLAGVVPVDPRPFPLVFVEAYRQLTWGEVFSHKLANAATLFSFQGPSISQADSDSGASDQRLRVGGFMSALVKASLGNAESAIRVRRVMFYSLAPSLGLLVLGPLFVIAGYVTGRRSVELYIARTCWIVVAVTSIIWCAIMFGPGTTFIHSGTYLTVLLAYVGSILSFWSFSSRLACCISFLQIAMNCQLYVGLTLPGHMGSAWGALVALSLVSWAAILWTSSKNAYDTPAASSS
jgi:hypothetical protein